MGGDGKKWPVDEARAVAEEIAECLAAGCERVQVAGSIRRRKPMVGDAEVLYIPRHAVEPDPNDMFASRDVNLADRAIADMERAGVLERRTNQLGRTTFGALIKLMRHRASGLPVDLFEATPANWVNYLVCRTGPADSNTRIASAAKARGWKWAPYSPGFEREDGAQVRAMTSEREVFEFVGLPYAEPDGRF